MAAESWRYGDGGGGEISAYGVFKRVMIGVVYLVLFASDRHQ